MSINLNIEHMFSNTYVKFIEEQEQSLQHMVCSHVLDTTEYAMAVGQLRALKDLKEKYKELLKAYFTN